MEKSVVVELTVDGEWKLRLPEAWENVLPPEIKDAPGFHAGSDNRPRLPESDENLALLARLIPNLRADPSVLLRDLLDAMRERGYHAGTLRLYFHYNRKFLQLTGLAPDHVRAEDLNSFLGTFAAGAVSKATRGLMHSALRFYYETVRGADFFDGIGRPRQEPRRPLILKPEQVRLILETGEDLMYRVILALIYSGGLRAREAAVLRLDDIIHEHGLIRVRETGDRPERFTPLTEFALAALDEYLADPDRKHGSNPEGFLFPAPRQERAGTGTATKTISPRSIERAFTRTLGAARIKERLSVHALRHAFAVHSLQGGEDRKRVAAYLGFKNTRSMRPYLYGLED